MDWGNLPGEMIEDISHGNTANNAPDEDPLSIMLIDYRVFLVKINLHDASPSVKVAYQFNLKDPDCNSSQVAAIRKVFHCDGLLLCTTKDKRLVGIKPRDRYKKHDYYALGYNNKKQYKVLRLDSQKILPIKNKYEIYDFTSDSWRVLGVTTDCKISSWRHIFQGKYLLGCYMDFDFTTEMFQSLSLPHPFSHSIAALSVALHAFIIQQEMYMYQRQLLGWENSLGSLVSWSELLTVKDHSEVNLNGLSFLADEQSKTLVYCNQSSKNNKIVHIVRGDTFALHAYIIHQEIYMYQRQFVGWEIVSDQLCRGAMKDHSEVNLNGLSFLADEQSKTLNNKIVHIVRGDTYVKVDPLDRSSTIRPSSSSSLLNYVPSLVQIKQGKSKACDL
ncbi:LOW QUALITY PROTEIN: hypothetical protein HID58_025463 [Brassica napus]|uniref:F-box associated beta-propeller type 1 domain-containing protein n=1 Tax=Brassica napus TaxID=3708 RepID=A0ABQ8CL70_BRANA|nr:LOW QUALITY PROTEIN: hypothetical protein HID58_025463 [Brassica napus]